MDEYKELAQAAGIALRIVNQPTWTDSAGVMVAGIVGLGQCALIRVEYPGDEGQQ